MFTAEPSLYFILAPDFRHCSDLCCSCLNTLLPCPALPCHGWSCLPSSASCSLFSAWNHRGTRVMHKVHLSDVTPVTSGQLELSPWQRGMATELSGRSCDCTLCASQQKRKPYIVIPSFTFLWCNSEKYQICWIIDMFTPYVLLCQHCPELLQRQHLISFKRISCLVLNSTPQNRHVHIFLQGLLLQQNNFYKLLIVFRKKKKKSNQPACPCQLIVWELPARSIWAQPGKVEVVLDSCIP